MDGARAADPDPWRNRLRDYVERPDARALEELTASAQSADLSPAAAVLLAKMAQGTRAAKRSLEVLRQVRQRHPDDFWSNFALGHYLSRLGSADREEALHYHTAAVALKPWSATAHLERGDALTHKGLLDEAIAEFHDAIRLLKQDAQREMAKETWRHTVDAEMRTEKAVEVTMNGYAEAHAKLAKVLRKKGLLDEAQRIEGHTVLYHLSEGSRLNVRGDFDGAIVEFREAIRLKRDDAQAHNALGVTFEKKGRQDEALDEYREAIRLQKDFALAHYNLGKILMRQGKFREAVEELRLSQQLATHERNRRPKLLGRWIQQLLPKAESLAALDARLPALLKGQEQPKDARDRMALAQCAYYKKFFAVSSRWYSEAFAKEPKLADDLDEQDRYDAACSSALAGCGQGKDADKLDAKQRARLRQQALDWLRADLKAYGRAMENYADKNGPAIAQRMQHWLKDNDFASVRGDKVLAKLPEVERKDWHQLWKEVEALRQQAAQPPKKANSARP